MNGIIRQLHFLLHKHQNDRRAIQQLHSQLLQLLIRSTRLWNYVLRNYSLGFFPQEAFSLFKHFQDRLCFMDSFTCSFLIKASANLGLADLGQQLHSLTGKLGFQSHVYVQTALVDMYATTGRLVVAQTVFDAMPEKNSVTWNAFFTGLIKWDELQYARAIFEAMPERDIVSWSALVDGYTRMGHFLEAVSLFRRMAVCDGIKPTELTLLGIFPALWNLKSLRSCQMVHAYGEKSGINSSDIRVMNSLLDTYSKCGSIESTVRVFDDIPEKRRNVVTWTSMISSFAMHGMAREAGDSLNMMKDLGLKPNQVTFLSVLNACSHGGLVDEGLDFFRKMVEECGVVPNIKHYGSLIDMLGRAGRLEEAEKIALKVPCESGNAVIWRSLLSACNYHGDVEMGKRVMQKIMERERRYGGDYVLLSNIFASSSRYRDSEFVRMQMDEQKAPKLPGISFA